MLDPTPLRGLLQPIVGEPLSGMWRAGGQVFQFGVQKPDTNRRGEATTRSDFVLKFIAADWRVVQAGRIITGSSDHTNNDRFFDADQLPEQPYDVEAWRLGRNFLHSVEEGKFIAESIQVGQFGDVTINLSNGLLIESFGSSGQDIDLWWFHDRRTDVSCLVFPSGQSIGNATRR